MEINLFSIPDVLDRVQNISSEYRQLFKRFSDFLNHCFRCQTSQKRLQVEKAFWYLYVHSQGDVGLVLHSLEVAEVIGLEIGLGGTSVIAGLLHELPLKADVPLVDIKNDFGPEVSKILQGFYNIKNTEQVFSVEDSDNIELYKDIIFLLSRDLRIVYLRLADRLVNLRHFTDIEAKRKDIIPLETLKIYAPLAEILGNYEVKRELEELAFMYYKPEIYYYIRKQLEQRFSNSTYILNKMSLPLIGRLFDQGYRFKILSRRKSVYSIYQKMIRKHIPLEKVYDVLGLRIILFSDASLPVEERIEREKKLCKEVGGIVESLYEIHPKRIRNWIDKPKDTGYMALHYTVKDAISGSWVEIQIRGEQMDQIAEFGYAAHWKYKGVKIQLEKFSAYLHELRNKLEQIDEEFDTDEAFSYIEKLFPVEKITVFTPDLKPLSLTKGATVLDFAAKLHSDFVRYIKGAEIRNKNYIVSPTFKLSAGDIVYILTDKHIRPKLHWLKYVKTGQARRILMEILGLKCSKNEGIKILEELLSETGLTSDPIIIRTLMQKFGYKHKHELYGAIGRGEISKRKLREIINIFLEELHGNLL